MPQRKKPRVFVGSSGKHKRYADAIQQNLHGDAFVTVWHQGAFRIGAGTLENLLRIAETHDFGVFVFSEDDRITRSGKGMFTPRDNVIFELGLFVGKLGKDHTFIVASEKLNMPSDLLGITYAPYDANDDDVRRAVGPACGAILERLNAWQQSQTVETRTVSSPHDLLIKELRKDRNTVAQGKRPSSPQLLTVMKALVKRSSATRPKMSPYRVLELVHYTGLEPEAVLASCEVLAKWRILLRDVTPGEWSVHTELSLKQGTPSNPANLEYWRNVLTS
jgi:predicted nucleotide-binding protein with TIR-like domain